MEKTYWLHVISPLHVGAGRGEGHIDLPIVREVATKWPYVPGSAVKGVIADKHNATKDEREKDQLIAAAFGKSGDSDSSAGALVFSDASIACLPVRSFYGTFAWITSPLALKRIRSISADNIAPEKNQAVVLNDNDISDNKRIYLEDLDLIALRNGDALTPTSEIISQGVFKGVNDEEGWRKIFSSRFAVVHDDIFSFLCETGTEVNARIRIDDKKKITAKGALWYEESLPVETILSGTVWCDKVYGGSALKEQELMDKEQELMDKEQELMDKEQELMDKFCKKPYELQIGGKASVGKGRVRCVFS